MQPEVEFLETLKATGIDFVSFLPCDRIKGLICKLGEYRHPVPLTREEEGVGISAGAYLAGARPAMFIQSSGLGNMINALLSLTHFYRLPLLLFISHRGLKGEPIKAQVPMGVRLPKLLRASRAGYTLIKKIEDFRMIPPMVEKTFKERLIHAFLLHPSLWSKEAATEVRSHRRRQIKDIPEGLLQTPEPQYRRYEVIKQLKPFLTGKVVVCNLGFPSKELYHLLHQPSNFYMLGSMGLASSIGLGISLCTEKEVVVIDGDGSILMNSGTLATVALMKPRNLTILAIDNGVYGSTGCQLTHTSSVADLSVLALAMGFTRIVKTSSPEEVLDRSFPGEGPAFYHILSKPGNENLSPIGITAEKIVKNLRDFLKN